MVPNFLSPHWIALQVDAKIYQRGNDYFEGRAVSNLRVSDHEVTAKVTGSGWNKYNVAITFGDFEVEEAECDCPYAEEWDGWCKHVVAVLLASVAHRYDPPVPRGAKGAVQTLALSSLLADASVETLRVVIESIVKRHPDIHDETLRALALANDVTGEKTISAAQLEAIQKEIRAVFYKAEKDDSYYSRQRVIKLFPRLVEEASVRHESGDVLGAMTMLEIIAEEFDRGGWCNYDQGDMDFRKMEKVWIAALKTSDLHPDIRKSYVPKLEVLNTAYSQYGCDIFHTIQKVAERG
jgi:SWIM zinc finger